MLLQVYLVSRLKSNGIEAAEKIRAEVRCPGAPWAVHQPSMLTLRTSRLPILVDSLTCWSQVGKCAKVEVLECDMSSFE
jgi:hypothetical protein